MKALLIAPNESPGLDPLAYSTPAPLIPLLGAPLLSPLLARLAKSGVREVVLACGARSAAFERFLLDGRPWGLNLAILETAAVTSSDACLHAVRAAGFHDQTLLVMPANCWTDASFAELTRLHQASGARLSSVAANGAPTRLTLVEPNAEPSLPPYSLNAVFRWRPVTSWREYAALAREAMENPDLDIAPRYHRCSEGASLAPLAHYDPLRASIAGRVWLGPGARIDPGASVKGPAWIGANCRIGPGVTVDACLVESRTHLQGPLEVRDSLILGARAIELTRGAVSLLDESAAPGPDLAMAEGLLQLATRTARKSSHALEPVG